MVITPSAQAQLFEQLFTPTRPNRQALCIALFDIVFCLFWQ
jgi:hypothetical protein